MSLPFPHSSYSTNSLNHLSSLSSMTSQHLHLPRPRDSVSASALRSQPSFHSEINESESTNHHNSHNSFLSSLGSHSNNQLYSSDSSSSSSSAASALSSLAALTSAGLSSKALNNNNNNTQSSNNHSDLGNSSNDTFNSHLPYLSNSRATPDAYDTLLHTLATSSSSANSSSSSNNNNNSDHNAFSNYHNNSNNNGGNNYRSQFNSNNRINSPITQHHNQSSSSPTSSNSFYFKHNSQHEDSYNNSNNNKRKSPVDILSPSLSSSSSSSSHSHVLGLDGQGIKKLRKEMYSSNDSNITSNPCGDYNQLSNGLQSGIQNGFHNGLQNGISNGIQNGLPNGFQNNQLQNSLANSLYGIKDHHMLSRSNSTCSPPEAYYSFDTSSQSINTPFNNTGTNTHNSPSSSSSLSSSHQQQQILANNKQINIKPKTRKKTGQRPMTWTREEEDKLRNLVKAGTKWPQITQAFPNRSAGAIKKHFYADMKHTVWQEDEDNALQHAFKEDESSKWRRIGEKLGRPAKACEKRMKELMTMGSDNYISPEQSRREYEEQEAREKEQQQQREAVMMGSNGNGVNSTVGNKLDYSPHHHNQHTSPSIPEHSSTTTTTTTSSSSSTPSSSSSSSSSSGTIAAGDKTLVSTSPNLRIPATTSSANAVGTGMVATTTGTGLPTGGPSLSDLATLSPVNDVSYSQSGTVSSASSLGSGLTGSNLGSTLGSSLGSSLNSMALRRPLLSDYASSLSSSNLA